MTGTSSVRQLFTRDVGIGSRSQLLTGDLEMISVITSSDTGSNVHNETPSEELKRGGLACFESKSVRIRLSLSSKK